LTREAADRIPPGRSGALLSNGDFLDGAIEIEGGWQLRVSNVLLGVRRLNIPGNEVVAAVLRPTTEAKCAYVVRSVDGSSFRVKNIDADAKALALTDVSGRRFTLAQHDVAEVRR
jgi:hypothetical protein